MSANVLGYLSEAPAALVLDNFETPWDQEQLETEEVLKQLSGIESLALAVTIRGSSRPLGVAWRDALQVAPLSGDDPKLLFLAIAGARHEKDAHLSRLLAALDGMPLAIELMAHAAEVEPDLESVWRRWQAERSEMLKRGRGDQRLLSLAVSLELSIASPRMTASARRLLAMLGLLPNGIARGDLNTLLPNCGHAAAATLRQTALAFDEAGRLRCLAPVREYVSAVHPPSSGDFHTLFGHHHTRQEHLRKETIERLKILANHTSVLRDKVAQASSAKKKDILDVDEIDQEINDISNEMELSIKMMTNSVENSDALLLHAITILHANDRRDLEAWCLFLLAKNSLLLAQAASSR